MNAAGTGADKCKLFIKERLIGNKSIWIATTSEITVTVSKELVNLKEERKLMSRFLVALRSIPGIDLSYYLGEYELFAVPRSLFAVDGSFHKTRDKADTASEMRKPYSNEIKRSMVLGRPVSRESHYL